MRSSFTDILQEAVEHIEDLPVDRFIQAIDNIQQRSVTERPVGINACFGIDVNGKIFIARSSTDSEKYYSVKDIPSSTNESALKSAIQAIVSISKKITHFLQPGDTIKCVLLFQTQDYSTSQHDQSKSTIVLTTPALDTPHHRFKELAKSLHDSVVVARTKAPHSHDGQTLTSKIINTRWDFKLSETIAVDTFRVSAVSNVLKALKDYLSEQNKALPNYSNFNVLMTNLSTLPLDKRDAVKEERNIVSEFVFTKFKFPIKNILVKQILHRMRSKIDDGTDDVLSVVLTSPRADDVKIVDTETFDLITSFKSETILKCSAQVKSVSKSEPLYLQGGIVGQCKSDAFEVLGQRQLSIPSSARAFIRSCIGSNEFETAEIIARKLGLVEADFPQLKTDIVQKLTTGCNTIRNVIADFKTNKQAETIKTKTGEVIKLNTMNIDQTMTVAAEAYTKLRTMIQTIQSAHNNAGLVKVMLGSSIMKVLAQENQGDTMSTIVEDEGAGGAEAGDGGADTTTANIATTPFAMFMYGMFPHLKVKMPKRIAYTKKHSRKRVAKHISEALASIETDDGGVLQEAYDFNSLTQTRQRLAMLKRNLESMDKNIPIRSRDLRAYFDTYSNLTKFKRTEEFAIELDTGEIVKLYIGADQAFECKNAIQSMIARGLKFDDILKSITGVYDVVDAEVMRTADEVPPHNFQLIKDTTFKMTKTMNPLADVSGVKIPQNYDPLKSLLTESQNVPDAVKDVERLSALNRSVLRISSRPHERALLAMLLKIGVPPALLIESRFEIKARLSIYSDVFTTNQKACLHMESILKSDSKIDVLTEGTYGNGGIDLEYARVETLLGAKTPLRKIILAVMLCLGLQTQRILKHRTVISKQLKATEHACSKNQVLKNAFVGLYTELTLETLLKDEMDEFDLHMPDGINKI